MNMKTEEALVITYTSETFRSGFSVFVEDLLGRNC